MTVIDRIYLVATAFSSNEIAAMVAALRDYERTNSHSADRMTETGMGRIFNRDRAAWLRKEASTADRLTEEFARAGLAAMGREFTDAADSAPYDCDAEIDADNARYHCTADAYHQRDAYGE